MKTGVDVLIFNDGFGAGGVWTRTGGAYRIATELRSMGLRVQVVDFWSYIVMEDDDLLEQIIDKFVGAATLFVGFSTTFLNWRLGEHFGQEQKVGPKGSYYSKQVGANALAAPESKIGKLRAFVKARNPKTDLVMGGARANTVTKHMDVVMQGYGEHHVRDYVLWRLGKNPFFQARSEGELMILDYNVKADGFDFGRSVIKWEPEDCIQWGETLPIEISRGCIFRCKFCSFPLNGRAKLDYLKDEGVLYEEFARNYEQWGIRKYVFADDTYNDTVEKLEAMQRIKDRLQFPMEFGTYGRLDLIAAHPEMAALMKSNGCTSVTFGIESLNRKAAASIGKGADPQKLVDTLYWLRESEWGNDVHTSSGFILGLPFDTEDTILKWTEPLLSHRFPLHSPLFIPLSIVEANKTTKKFISVFDQHPEEYGYVHGPNGWVNDRFGTSYARCEDMAFNMFQYAYANGRNQAASHVLIGIEDRDFRRDVALGVGLKGLNEGRSKLNQTHVRYMRYLEQVMGLETT